jgi:hypothetical protein
MERSEGDLKGGEKEGEKSKYRDELRVVVEDNHSDSNSDSTSDEESEEDVVDEVEGGKRGTGSWELLGLKAGKVEVGRSRGLPCPLRYDLVGHGPNKILFIMGKIIHSIFI